MSVILIRLAESVEETLINIDVDLGYSPEIENAYI